MIVVAIVVTAAGLWGARTERAALAAAAALALFWIGAVALVVEVLT